MSEIGLKNSLSDAGVGALCARTAIFGAGLNVRTNCSDLDDESEQRAFISRAEDLESQATALEGEILERVREKL
jgi:glutamate formiminotransferase/formiminotetrahydrofolate cyclodeaminase